MRQTERARRFLEGLRDKINHLLANPAGTLRNEKARKTLLSLRRDIDEELAKTAAEKGIQDQDLKKYLLRMRSYVKGQEALFASCTKEALEEIEKGDLDEKLEEIQGVIQKVKEQ